MPGAFKESLAVIWAKRLPTTAGCGTGLLPWDPPQVPARGHQYSGPALEAPARSQFSLPECLPLYTWGLLNQLPQLDKPIPYKNSTHKHIRTHTHTQHWIWLDLFLWLNPNTCIHICSQLLLLQIHFYLYEIKTNFVQYSQAGHRKV